MIQAISFLYFKAVKYVNLNRDSNVPKKSHFSIVDSFTQDDKSCLMGKKSAREKKAFEVGLGFEDRI